MCLQYLSVSRHLPFKMAALYSCAANIIDKVLKKHGTVKSLAINSHFRKKKKLYALVCETLKYSQILQEIFEQTKLLKLEKKLKPNYALVLVYDFLFGQGIQCGGELKQSIMKHKSALQSCLARLKVRAKVHRNEDLLPKHALEIDCIPRYVRSNRIKTSVEDVILEFKQNGFEQVHPKNVGSFVTQTKKIRSKQFMCDNHLPDVLVFPLGTDLHDHPLFVSGRIVLQDKLEKNMEAELKYEVKLQNVDLDGNSVGKRKLSEVCDPDSTGCALHNQHFMPFACQASCLPAHVLHPPPGSHVIDACAAPGNKSSHLASLMNNKGKIFAFDIDNKRLTVMQKLMVTAGASCVTTTNCSFMEVDPLDERYSNVEYIVVDPSCSGSGIVSRMDKFVNEVEETSDKKQRLESLAKFQLSALNHALSFPFVKRVVYSTCSIHQQENEDVVAAALKANSDRFQLEHSLPSWTHRGLDVFQGADKCIRASPIEDYTNGFFVALFVRKDSKTENKFAESKDTSTEREGKLENEDMNGENSSLSAFQKKDSKMPLKSRPDAVASKDSDLSTRRKRRKRNNKKRKEAKSQGDPPAEPSVGNSRLINDKTKRNQRKKKKNKKVSVCS